MKRLTTYFLFLFFFIYANHLSAQITISFAPAINGQTLNGLAYGKIMNYSGTDLLAELTIRVKEARQGTVVTVKTPEFVLSKGVNDINRVAFSKAKIIFGTSTASRLLNQNQRFCEGDYEYCYEITATYFKTSQPFGYFENCFNQIIEPVTPLLLIDPLDGEKLCNKRPNLTWQPPMPLISEYRYRVILSEVNEFQTPSEAIVNNMPVFVQTNLNGNMLMYPFNAPDLTDGKKYAWQVSVYTGNTIVTKSEIWVFTVGCDKENEKKEGDSYREVKTADDGGSYIAEKVLRFSFKNQYTETDLNYTIQSLSNPDLKVKKLPKLKLRPGLNYYELDLTRNNFFKNGEQYLLVITGSDNRKYTLRFVYAD